MSGALAVGGFVQGIAVLAAAGAAALALVAGSVRLRAGAMLAALGLAVVALVTVVGTDLADLLGRRPALAAAAALAGAGATAALAGLVYRRPGVFALLAVGALPFRVPLPIGEESANLLLPLYVVIAAGCLAYAVRCLRGPRDSAADGAPWPALRRLELALAGVIVLYALQSLYSTDTEQAVKNVCFFYLPFALLFRLLLDVRWSRLLALRALGLTVGLALAFALVGFAEYGTGHLLIDNSKVLEANELKPYFRVNSLFFDPNIFGRYLALTMILLGAALLWSGRRREAGILAGALAVLWAALVLSLSQSSFAALLLGLAVLAVLRWRAAPVVIAVSAAVAVSGAVILVAPGAVGLQTRSIAALDRATSGRVDLIQGGLSMVADRPLWGFGSGAFAERYRAREQVRSERVAAASHTIPLTVAAEQGVIGLAAYAWLLWAAFALVIGGVRTGLRRVPPGLSAVARAGLAAAFAGFVLHTLVYAAFLEDPLAWALLALSAAVGFAGGGEATAKPGGEAVPAAPAPTAAARLS